MYNPSSRYCGATKPNGYFPRLRTFPSLIESERTPYAPYRAGLQGQPARLRFDVASAVLADYNTRGFNVHTPGFPSVRYQFYTGAPPAPPIVGIFLPAATLIGIAVGIHTKMITVEPAPTVGPYRAVYLNAGGVEDWDVSAVPTASVGLIQPYNGSFGNQLITVDASLSGILLINGITDYDAGSGFSPLFFDGMGFEVPMLWGLSRALGPSSLPTLRNIPNPED